MHGQAKFRVNIYIENIYINMPISTDTIILCAGLFVLIIVAMMFGSSGIVPHYGFVNKSLQSHPYEGFVQAMEYFENRDDDEVEGFSHLNPADYNDVPTATLPGESLPAVNSGVPMKVTGFDGVQGDAIVENNGLMGYLAMNPARPDCVDYGYTKSTGKVCFNPTDVKLLTTRGGNFK
jgi:hypothetical protein